MSIPRLFLAMKIAELSLSLNTVYVSKDTRRLLRRAPKKFPRRTPIRSPTSLSFYYVLRTSETTSFPFATSKGETKKLEIRIEW